jgi:hypothetical protein
MDRAGRGLNVLVSIVTLPRGNAGPGESCLGFVAWILGGAASAPRGSGARMQGDGYRTVRDGIGWTSSGA